MTARQATVRRPREAAAPVPAGTSVDRPAFHRPANDNRVPVTTWALEWLPLAAIAVLLASLVWWIV